MIGLAIFALLAFLAFSVVVIGVFWAGIPQFVMRQLKLRGNPLYTRCSCNHMASQHNYSGCVRSGCSCRVSAGVVVRHGVYDNALHSAHLEKAYGIELGDVPRRPELLSPDEVLQTGRGYHGDQDTWGKA